MDENYFGKNGFTSPQSLHRKENTINLKEVDEFAQTSKGSVDLTSMGYTKLLGKGKITKALTITVPACSVSAAEKVQTAGGKVITEAEVTAESEQ